jgi:hypothetical protein
MRQRGERGKAMGCEQRAFLCNYFRVLLNNYYLREVL